jgi:hypothetical protein
VGVQWPVIIAWDEERQDEKRTETSSQRVADLSHDAGRECADCRRDPYQTYTPLPREFRPFLLVSMTTSRGGAHTSRESVSRFAWAEAMQSLSLWSINEVSLTPWHCMLVSH